MKTSKGEVKASVQLAKVELELEKDLLEQLLTMEKFTKISKSEIVTTALKRFISSHKDYFPEG
jgi:metal-responsive CopG/Arc/MetJ family transcriptional regulator